MSCIVFAPSRLTSRRSSLITKAKSNPAPLSSASPPRSASSRDSSNALNPLASRDSAAEVPIKDVESKPWYVAE